MRLLILGAGGVGGYFGGRLIEAGGEASFLVRPKRAAQLAQNGLVVESPHGNFTVPVKTLTAATDDSWDLVLLSCKAYDLEAAIAAIAPAVGPRTHVLPLLNGLRHIDALDAQFGAGRVLGGVAYIAASLTPLGVVKHLNSVHRLGFGARDGQHPPSLTDLRDAFARSKIDTRLLDDPIQALWDKWVLLGTLAAMTCLMRAPVGRITATVQGTALIRACLAEVVSVAAAAGHAPASSVTGAADKMLTEKGSAFAASMLRDIERAGPTEGAHVVGDLVERAAACGVETPLLRTAWVHLQAYEQGRSAA